MKFVVIGLGSMGKRRIRILKEYIRENHADAGQDEWNICGVDSKADRCEEVQKLYDINTSGNLEQTLHVGSFDAALVCTSPQSHGSIINQCLNVGLHVFTEINLVSDDYDDNIKLASEKGKVLYLSSTPMHRREMKYIKNWVGSKNYKLSYRYNVGQYLPEWHPWETYNDFFVGDKRTNGCRELFAIELPWLIDTFGKIIEYRSQHNKLTGLKYEYDDSYQVIIKHSSGVQGVLMVDVVTPKPGRRMELFGENSYLIWEGTPTSLCEMDCDTKNLMKVSLYDEYEHQNGYESFVVEDAYLEEIKEFILCVKENRLASYSFEEDMGVLRIIDGIESGCEYSTQY